MSIICKNCGKELADNAKFCGGCGSKIEAEPVQSNGRLCPACGAALTPGVNFCASCGLPIEPIVIENEPTEMEELVPPVITDDTFAVRPQEDIPAEMEGIASQAYTQPAPEPVIPTPAPIPVPAPAPVQENVYRAPEQPAYQQPQQPMYQQQYAQPNIPQQPNNMPQYQPYPDPNAVNTVPGKKGSGMLVPIILILLILGVIAFDVFYLFRDKIFGSDDSSSKKSTSSKASVSSVVDDDDEEDDDEDNKTFAVDEED